MTAPYISVLITLFTHGMILDSVCHATDPGVTSLSLPRILFATSIHMYASVSPASSRNDRFFTLVIVSTFLPKVSYLTRLYLFWTNVWNILIDDRYHLNSLLNAGRSVCSNDPIAFLVATSAWYCASLCDNPFLIPSLYILSLMVIPTVISHALRINHSKFSTFFILPCSISLNVSCMTWILSCHILFFRNVLLFITLFAYSQLVFMYSLSVSVAIPPFPDIAVSNTLVSCLNSVDGLSRNTAFENHDVSFSAILSPLVSSILPCFARSGMYHVSLFMNQSVPLLPIRFCSLPFSSGTLVNDSITLLSLVITGCISE